MAAPPDDLVNRAGNGDSDALTALLVREGPAVVSQLEGKIPRRWQSVLSVDDVMQQTFTDAFLDIDRFVPDGRGSFALWLSKLAQCNLCDVLRLLEADKRGGGRPPLSLNAVRDSRIILCRMLGANIESPSKYEIRKEVCNALELAMRQLSQVHRQAVQLYDLDERPIDEVARALTRSPTAVHMLRVRAHRELREILGRTSKYFPR